MITQKKALELAIKCLVEAKRKHTPGHVAYTQQGITDLEFAIRGHKHYTEYSEAIRQLEDLIEILQDPGATLEPEETQGRLL